MFNPEWNIPESIADSEVVPKIVSDPGYAERQGIEVVNAEGERVPREPVLGPGAPAARGAEGEEDDGRRRASSPASSADGRRRGERRARREPTPRSTTLPAGYRLRQAPGRQNPLGQVKFMFPNEHNIYLHDTPAD